VSTRAKPKLANKFAMPPSSTISVIMPAFNAAHYLERSLPPLIKLRDQQDVSEVIVVDDCSTDPANVETARRLGATIMSTPANGGPGAARNLAAKVATGAILWFVDADVVAHATGPGKIREALADETVVAAFGSYDDEPPAMNFASQYKNLVHRYYHQRGRDDASTFWAGCGAVRRSSFIAIGGFDHGSYKKPAIEDIELGHRLRDAGGRIRLTKGLLGTHLKRWSLIELIRTDIFQRALPWSRLLLSSPKKDDDLNVSQAEKMRAVIAIAWIVSVLALPLVTLAPPLLWGFLLTTPLMLFANWPLMVFFHGRHGPLFAIAALLFHQVYYFYSTATYAYCVLERGFAKPAVKTSADAESIERARRVSR